jgi:hypothetical protein
LQPRTAIRLTKKAKRKSQGKRRENKTQ